MAPIKFEEDMKDKLEKRSIQPSAKSWNSLSQRLDKEEKKNNKKGFWWLGIAASFIGVLLVSNLFFKTDQNNIIIVKENTTKDSLKIEVLKQIITTPKQEVIVKTEENTIKNKIKKTNKNLIANTKYYVNNTIENSKENTNNTVNKTQIKTPLLVNKSSIQDEPIVINNKDKTSKIKVTDNELDALLNKASLDIAMQKTEPVNIPVDYNRLLIEVEDELDGTFREKMFKVVKKGYETVIESVAERNN